MHKNIQEKKSVKKLKKEEKKKLTDQQAMVKVQSLNWNIFVCINV